MKKPNMYVVMLLGAAAAGYLAMWLKPKILGGS